jgi:hypothetical protein
MRFQFKRLANRLVWACGTAAVLAAAIPAETRADKAGTGDPSQPKPASSEERLFHGVRHSPQQPKSGQPVQVTVKVSRALAAHAVALEYQAVDPGKYIALADPAFRAKWASVPMKETGGSGEFAATLPAELQVNRRLVRYRVVATASNGSRSLSPTPEDSQPNYAYFVYDGIPAWKGSIDPRSFDPRRRFPTTFEPEIMSRVQSYHLISSAAAVEKATWTEPTGGKEYRYTGTLVADGKVYDHVRFRARGGVWRHAMGKNMWKVDFNSGHALEARDDYGHPYQGKWGKLNLRACIQQGDYGHRGEQGMFEAVGFRLFNLAGVESPRTHWVQMRFVTGAEETPSDQYRGDYWGLYLAIENEDGRFLKEHSLPDGNLYKMMGLGILSHHGAGASTNGADVGAFLNAIQRPTTETWWRENVDLARYYSYRTILEGIHHYDVDAGKNYDFYLNPQTRRWVQLPWDIDLTWADNMYGWGQDPFMRAVLNRPALRRDFAQRAQEIRDLLFNPEQAGQLIDECASIIADPSGKPSVVDADRAKWDFNPVMISGHVMQEKAGHGLFYRASSSGDFAGMIRLMKEYVVKRSRILDEMIGATGAPAPKTPEIQFAPDGGTAALAATQLQFKAAPPGGSDASAISATEWRLGEVNDLRTQNYTKGKPGVYEITPVWLSGEKPGFQGATDIPAAAVKGGHVYRARVRVRDASGRWSHWSKPAQFVVSPANAKP